MAKTVVCQNPQCPRYHQPMTYTGKEYEHAWQFYCDDHKAEPKGCGNYRIVTKDKVGGTFGSGAKSINSNKYIGRGV